MRNNNAKRTVSLNRRTAIAASMRAVWAQRKAAGYQPSLRGVVAMRAALEARRMTTTQRVWDALRQAGTALTVGQVCHAVGISEGHAASALKLHEGRSFTRGPVIVGPSGREAQTWLAVPDCRPKADERGRGRPSEEDETDEAVEAKLQRIEAAARARRGQRWSAA